MINKIITIHTTMLTRILNWQEEHPYASSCILSIIIVLYMLFATESLLVTEDQLIPPDKITFIDIEAIRAPQRKFRKEISTEQSETVEEHTVVERAVGTTDEENVYDSAFFPNIVPPKLVNKLLKKYPPIARERNIEATLNLQLWITSSGKVKNVTILGIKLNKELPPELEEKISKAFARDAQEIMLKAKYTFPILEGKKIDLKMDVPLKFRLD